jgi:glycosyltransferase involved in cell wall biosynthesis
VGILIAHYPPNASGAELQARAQAIELARQGHSVRVITSRVEGLPATEERDGLAIHRWISPRSVGPLFGPTFVRSTVKALMRLRPELDIVHAHQGLWEAIASGWGKRTRRGLRDLPVLIQPASSGAYGEAHALRELRGWSWWRRVLLRNDAFAAISGDIAREWRDLGVPEDRIHTTASGVDAERFRPGPGEVPASFPVGPRVVFTGRLHPQKNLDLLIDAWPEVVERARASLVLVGQGPEEDRLRERARGLGVGEFVHFPGRVDDPAGSLRAADLFVLPSVAEGMSNSLLEAMATGLPCLVTRIGGNTDLIEDGRTGRLLPPGDPGAWARAIVELLRSPETARSLGANARGLIEDRYALPRVVASNVGLYRRLLRAAGPPPAG